MANRTVSWVPKSDVFQAVPPDSIDAFLVRRGWVQKPSAAPQMRYYEHSEMLSDDGKRMSYYFPDTNVSAEYPDCVLRFVENQARFWELAPLAVLAELQGGPLAEPVRTSVPA